MGSSAGRAGTGEKYTPALPGSEYPKPPIAPEAPEPKDTDLHPGGYFDKDGTWHPEDPPAKQYDRDEEGNPIGEPWFPVPKTMMYDEAAII